MTIAKRHKPVALVIMDGLGLRKEEKANAVRLANTPNLDRLMRDYPHVSGSASGLDVGLPDGQMGNSEVGHLNMGAGRVVYQDLTKITKAIEDGDFFENKELCRACDAARGHSLHLWGLLSDGGVHSHNTHLYGLLSLAKKRGVENVYVHAFMDGRDTDPTSGFGFLEELSAQIKNIGCGKLATVCGRYYAMDRDKRWERIKEAYDALTAGEGVHTDDLLKAVKTSYENKVTDEFIKPVVLYDGEKPVGRVQDGDSVIFFNFRPDRAREITRAFVDPEFDGFSHRFISSLTYVCFTEYDASMPNVTVAFPKEHPKNTLGRYVSQLGLKQLRLAETEKYAHVTFFFNGGIEEPDPGEDRILVPSPKVATYDLQPEMSAPQVGEKLVEAISGGKYDLIITNFANPDMVGHTGVLSAAIKAVETVDACVGAAADAILKEDGVMLICADHGNCEVMEQEDGSPMTAHTSNPVPFMLISNDGLSLDKGGRLCDLAPTLLDIMGLEKPAEMTGRSLLIK